MSKRPFKGHTMTEIDAIIAAPDIGEPMKKKARIEKIIRRTAADTRSGLVEKGWDVIDTLDEDPPKPERVRAMRFCLPLPPNRANARKHWTGTYRTDERFFRACDALADFGTFPDAPDAPYQRVRVHATFYVWSEMDEDNLMARVKPALDWIVSAGYIANDTKANIEWAGIPEQKIDRGCPRLVLRISHPKKETPDE